MKMNSSEINTVERSREDVLLLAEHSRRHDRALLCACHGRSGVLPQGFTADTLQRIRAVQARRERRARIVSWTLAAVVCLCGMATVAVVCLPVFEQMAVLMKAALRSVARDGAWLMPVAVCFVLNGMLRRHFHPEVR